MHFDGKFGPTVLQVAAGVYAGFLWACQNPNSGCKFADQIDADFVIDQVSILMDVSVYLIWGDL